MNRKQRIKFGFIGLALCVFVGALSVKGKFEPGQIFATIAGILFFIGAYKAIFFGTAGSDADAPVTTQPRDNELLKRLADLQEIVISIDDRLKRLEQNRQLSRNELHSLPLTNQEAQ